MDDDTQQSRWLRIQELFDHAVDLSEQDQDAFLDEACADDPQLRQDVASLLIADATGGLRVRNLISDTARRALVSSDGSAARIGPYELLQEIGNGGMGAVYLAERIDDEFRQRVAIKRLHRTMVTPEFLARFRSERQILADLNHPNIAHLIDGGTTDDGVPYLVMEYIEGKPINQYCDDNQLNIDQRLDLFRQVCSALEMAHQNLIVHRDIKPNNILVSREGIPKLLDFGIAKSLTSEAADEGLTEMGDRILTPNHASPEQVMGRPVTTASDIYSLGVLLYELLCGVCPFSLARCSPAEMERIVTTLEAEAPSILLFRDADYEPAKGRARCPEAAAVAMDRGTTPEKLRRKLRGDLDNLVLKALHKDRKRRYASVGRLSEDVRRYLRGMPVEARPDSFGYRAGKFILRNRWSVAAVSAFVASLAVFSLVTFFQAKELARTNRSLDQVVTFFADLFEPADPFSASIAQRAASDGADDGRRSTPGLDFESIFNDAARLLLSESDEQTTLEFTKLQKIIGLISYRLDHRDEARQLLQRALDIRERRLGPNDPSLIEILVLLSDVEAVSNNVDEVCELANRAHRIATEQLGAPDKLLALTQGTLAWYSQAFAQHTAGGCPIASGDTPETLYRAALANYASLGDMIGQARNWRGLGELLRNRGGKQAAQEALAAANEALKFDLATVGEDHMRVALDYQLKAAALLALEQHAEATRLAGLAIEIHNRTLTSRPDLPRLLALVPTGYAGSPMPNRACTNKPLRTIDSHSSGLKRSWVRSTRSRPKRFRGWPFRWAFLAATRRRWQRSKKR